MANKTSQFNIKINGTEQIVELNDLLNQTTDNLSDAKKAQDSLSQAFEQADYGTVEYLKLKDALQDVNSEIKTVDESIEGLTFAEKFQGAAQSVGAVANAFAFASTSIKAFGDENSRTAQQVENVEARILAIQQGFQTFSELTESFTAKNGLFRRSIDAVSKGFTSLGISAKGSGLAIRGALAATGIGLLAVGIGLVIENFDKLKELAAPLIKSFQPFFDGIRNVASLLTGGLISDAATAKLENTFDNLAKANQKIFDDANKEIDRLQSKTTLGLQSTIENSNRLLQNNIKSSTNLFSKVNDAVKEILLVTSSLGISTTTSLARLSSNLDNNLRLLQNTNLTIKDRIEIEQDLISQLQVESVLIKDNNSLTAAQKKLISEELLKAEEQINENLNKRLSFLNQISQEQAKIRDIAIQISDIELQTATADLDNARALIDIVKSQTGTVDFTKELGSISNLSNAAKVLNDELNRLFQTIDDPALDNIFLQAKTNVDLVINGIDALIKRNNILAQKEIQLGKDRINSQKLLNQRLLENANLFEIDATQRQKNIDTTNELNRLLDEQSKLLEDQISDKYIKINNELIKQKEAFIDNRNQQRQILELDTFEVLRKAIEDFTNGVTLSTNKINDLKTLLPNIAKELDFTKAFNLLPLDEQNKKLKIIAEQIKLEYLEILEAQLKTTTDVGKENDLKQKTAEIIRSIFDSTRATVNANNELKKQYEEQLILLREQSAINKLEAEIASPARSKKQFETQRANILAIDLLRTKSILDTFNKETKGLEQTDVRYQISLEKRDEALRELNRNTIKQLEESRIAFNKLVIESYGSIAQSAADVFNSINKISQDAINRNISANQLQIDLLTEKIAQLNEEISFLDTLIEERKNIIKDLEAQAAEATGAQRQEILKQIESEAEATRLLLKEKRALAKQEQDAAKQQQKLEKDNQKLQLQSIVLDQQAAVAAQILSLAQAGLAVASIAASSAKNDPTFGIATTAAIIAVSAAIATNIVGLVSSIKNLQQANQNLAQFGGAKGGFPDSFEPMAEGGFTPKKGYGIDKTGEDNVGTYRLHANEYVVPRWMVESAKYGSMVSEIEKARKRGFADGGSPVPIIQSNNNQQLTNLLAASLNKPIFVAVTDINEGQTRVNVIEQRGRF